MRNKTRTLVSILLGVYFTYVCAVSFWVDLIDVQMVFPLRKLLRKLVSSFRPRQSRCRTFTTRVKWWWEILNSNRSKQQRTYKSITSFKLTNVRKCRIKISVYQIEKPLKKERVISVFAGRYVVCLKFRMMRGCISFLFLLIFYLFPFLFDAENPFFQFGLGWKYIS
jgi:hypothetical protein